MAFSNNANKIAFAKVSRLSASCDVTKKAQSVRRKTGRYDESGKALRKRLLAMGVSCFLVVATGITVLAMYSGLDDIEGYQATQSGSGDPLARAGDANGNNTVMYGAGANFTVLPINAPLSVLEYSMTGQPDYEEPFHKDNLCDEPEAPIFEEDLLLGTSSELVETMQQRLISLGFLDTDYPTDYFDSATQEAVRLFQRQHGLEITQYASAEFLNVLFSENAQIVATTTDDEGWGISAIQARLAVLGYAAVVTGIFDDDTIEAVAHFQSMNGLAVTGRISRFDEDMLFTAMPVCANGQRRAIAEVKEDNEFSAALLIDNALQYLGMRYTWGGKSPATGFDCSGFVYYVLNKSGFEIDYMTDWGWRSTTGFTRVESMNDLQAGDVLIFAGHVGIYIGNGTMIDSSFSTGRVRITDVDESFWRAIWVSGRRLV